MDYIVNLVLPVVLVMISAIIHEVAHGWVAYKCGDPTAKEAGRLTLNPMAHIDPFGSIVLPLLMSMTGGPVFAFAKPVPYNPYRLKNPKRDEVLVALAGPLSNLIQAILGALLFRLIQASMVSSMNYDLIMVYFVLQKILLTYVIVNLSLMFFNLIPLPPLDGSSLISVFLKPEQMANYYKVQSYSMPILLVALFILPSVFHIDPIGAYLDTCVFGLAELLLGLV